MSLRKKTVFNNSLFYYLLISFIIALLLYNIYTFVTTGNTFAFVPITIQLVLLILIFSKNQYARISIIVWASLVLLLGSGLEIVGAVLDIPNGLIDGFNTVLLDSYIFDLVEIALGVLIISYTRRTVVIVRDEVG